MHIINTTRNDSDGNVNYYKIGDTDSFIYDSKNRLRSNPVFKAFILPFMYLGWIYSCLVLGSKLIRAHDIEYIFVSHRPPNVIFLGYLLKLVNQECKLITEYRDSWTDNPYSVYPSRLMKRFMEIVEYQILDKSDLVIVVSTVEKNRLKKYSNIVSKVVIIRNGFFNYNLGERNRNKIFTITHSGSFYGSRQPDKFLEGYKKFLNMENRKDTKLLFIGDLDKANVNKILKLGLNEKTVITGMVDYYKALKLIYDSNLLVLIEYTDSMTSKIYDYISSGNPILVLSKNKELINFTMMYSPHSVIIKDDNYEKIADGINDTYLRWKQGNEVSFPKKDEFYRNYSRENLALKLVNMIEKL